MEKYKIENNTIIFNDDYNSQFDIQTIEDIKKVRKIQFNDKSKFNQIIHGISWNIVVIEFGDYFNQPIDNKK